MPLMEMLQQFAAYRAVANEVNQQPLAWAVGSWQIEVKGHPLNSDYYRALDETWRKVIRHFGGNPDELCQ